MKVLRFPLISLLCALLPFFEGGIHQSFAYKQYPRTGVRSVKGEWPELALISKNPQAAILVRHEFIRQGWDSPRIKAYTRIEMDVNVVKALTVDGDVDIPVGNQGLNSAAVGAIRGIVSYYRPKNRPKTPMDDKNCYFVISMKYWKPSTPNGAIIAEFRRPLGWEYRLGKKDKKSITFTQCFHSSSRLDHQRLPWSGDWMPVTENPPVGEEFPFVNEILRAWFQPMPFKIKIEPVRIIREKQVP